MQTLFLDESGDHSLDIIDPEYPVFVLGGVIVERFCFALADSRETEPGRIVAERRDPTLDAALRAAWRHLLARGTSYLRPAMIRERISRLELRSKQPPSTGLELADLVVSPIGRFVAGKSPREDWAIVEDKLRRRQGSYEGAGLVVLPKG